MLNRTVSPARDLTGTGVMGKVKSVIGKQGIVDRHHTALVFIVGQN